MPFLVYLEAEGKGKKEAMSEKNLRWLPVEQGVGSKTILIGNNVQNAGQV